MARFFENELSGFLNFRWVWVIGLALLGPSMAVAVGLPSTYPGCQTRSATVSWGGVVNVNMSTCHSFGLGTLRPGFLPAHGTATPVGGPVNSYNYQHNGSTPAGGGTDVFHVLDDNSDYIVVTVTIQAPASAIAVSPASLPAMNAGTPFSQTLSSTGGLAPYTYTLQSGTLPLGLSLSGGVLSGTPTQRGSYGFTVRSTDATTPTAQFVDKGYSGTVNPAPLSITPASATAIQSTPFSQALTITGGVAPHSCLLEPGPSFPAGINISSGCVISGTTAAAPGNYPVTIRVTDNSTGVGTHFELESFTLTVSPPPSVSIAVSPASMNEDAVGTLTYTVTRSLNLSSPTTVNISTSGTATSGVDYTGGVASVVIPAGATTATISIDPTADSIVEANETVILTVATGTGYTVAAAPNNAATGTITDDDLPSSPSSVTTLGAPASVAGTTTLAYTVPAGTNRLLVVTASNASAIVAPTVSFGATPMTLVVARDDTFAIDSMWRLALGSSASPTSGTITVTGFATAANTVITAQGFAGVNQTTPIDGTNSNQTTGSNLGSSLTLNTTTVGDLVYDIFDSFRGVGSITATPGASQSGVHDVGLSIVAPGTGLGRYLTSTKAATGASTTMSWTSNTEAILHLAANINAEPASASPTVTSPTQSAVTTNSATLGGNVTADGGASISARGIVISPTAINNNPLIGGSGVTNLTTTGTTGVFTLNAGSLTANTAYSFKAYATNSVGTGYSSVGTFTTLPPNLTINDVTANEGNAGVTSFTFTVSLSAPAGPGGVTFDIATANSTATAGVDYVASSLTNQTIPAGSSTYTFTVLVNGDLLNESNETFFVNVTNVVGANAVDGQGVGTITNDDPLPSLSINDVTVVEGNVGTVNAVFTVTLSAASGQTVQVNYATADGTATQPADYTSTSGTLTFTPGQTTRTITVPVIGETIPEANETFFVNLSGAVNATISDNQSVGTITNDDASADLSITKTDGVSIAVPGGGVTYTIVASNAGPSNVAAANVVDTFPATLTCAWTCVGAGGGTCTPAGSGNINEPVGLPVGGSVTFTASCTIAASATGTLSNTATISSSTTDPNPGNNSATDSDTLTPQADLSITKTDGVTTVAPGGSVTYTITAANAGPSNAPGATVVDTFPAACSTVSWSCVGASGGICSAVGSGNINDAVTLPVGASVSYTATCSVSLAASGTLSNTATVVTPGGITDPNAGNNSATDTDTIAQLAQTVTFNPTTPVNVGTGPYTLTASATSGLTTFTFTTSSPNTVCTVAGDQLTIVGVGTCALSATQLGNATYLGASASANVVINQGTQTVTFAPATPVAVGVGPITLSATASSGLTTFSFNTTSANTICTVSGNTLTIVGVGNCVLTATQIGNANYASASANATVVVNQGTQTVTFAPATPVAVGVGPITLSATASSGLTTFSFNTTSANTICTVSGNTLTIVGVGNCVLTATQIGNANYASASANATVVVNQGTQTVTFTPATPVAVGVGPITLSATASSGLTTFSFNTTSANTICTVSGNTLTIVGVGNCVLTATQIGNANYASASANATVVINQGTQTVTFAPATPVNFATGPYTLTATASSGLTTFTYSTSAAASICTVSGDQLTIVGIGSCPLTATQPGNTNYLTASANATVVINPVAPGAPTIGAATPGNAQANIAFTPPASNGGSPIITYTVTCNPGSVTASGAASPVTVTGLTNGTVYSCTVIANNAAGPSAPSASVSVTPRTVPGAPTIGAATIGVGQVTIAFTPSASDGGSPITGYTARCVSALGTVTATGSGSPIVVTGLTNGMLYQCSVVANNLAGESPASASVTVDLPALPVPLHIGLWLIALLMLAAAARLQRGRQGER